MNNCVDTCIVYSSKNSDRIEDFIKPLMIENGYEFCDEDSEFDAGMFVFLPQLCKFISESEPDWIVIDKVLKQFPDEKFKIFSIDTGSSNSRNTYGWYLECKGEKILKGDKKIKLFTSENLKKVFCDIYCDCFKGNFKTGDKNDQ